MTRRLSSRKARASSSAGAAPGRDESAVALEKRQLVGQRRFKIALERAAVGAQPGVGREELGREIVSRLEQAPDRRRRGKAVPDRREVARAAAVEAEARQRAHEIGRMRERARSVSRSARRLDEEIERIEPPVDGLGVGQRTRQALGKQARAGGRHGSIDRRQQRALARAAQGPA